VAHRRHGRQNPRRRLTATPDTRPPVAPEAIALYSEVAAAQVADKRAAKESLERRALQVVTTSGTLLTIIFGLVALVTREQAFVIPTGARVFLYVSLVLFVVAAGLGLYANKPSESYDTLAPDGLRKVIDDSNHHSEFGAHVRIAKAQVAVLESYLPANRRLAELVGFAILVELVAAASLAGVAAYLIAAQ
jgi:hypothetical protein